MPRNNETGPKRQQYSDVLLTTRWHSARDAYTPATKPPKVCMYTYTQSYFLPSHHTMQVVYERDRFLSTPESARAKLEECGVAIIPNTLDSSALEAMNAGIWDTLEHLSSDFPIDKQIFRSVPSSYQHIAELQPSHGMLFQYQGIGHAPYVWEVRQNPAVTGAFAAIWNCDADKLHTSFDAVSFCVPPERRKSGGFHTRDWMHSDQSFISSKFACVQGFINGYDVHDGDATLAVFEGSHLLHAKFAKTLPAPTSARERADRAKDWYKLTPEQVAWYAANGCKRVSVKARAGDLVLWDSRTIHCGQGPIRGRASSDTYRHVVYVCMTPKASTPLAKLAKRKEAFKNLRMTTHWPSKVRLFGKSPNTWGKPLLRHKALPAPILTKVGKSLVA